MQRELPGNRETDSGTVGLGAESRFEESGGDRRGHGRRGDRKSTRLNSSHQI
jgi:hypothetical protein